MLVALYCLLVVLSTTEVWAHRTLLNTGTFVGTVSPVFKIQQAPARAGNSMSSAPGAGGKPGTGPRRRLPATLATRGPRRLPPSIRALCGAAAASRPAHMIVLNLVLIGLVITLEPIPLTAFILILASKGGVRKGAAFIFGWLLSLAIVIAFTLLVTDNKPPKPSTAPSLAALAAKLAIGVGLTVIAIRQYRKLGKPRPPKKTPNGRQASTA